MKTKSENEIKTEGGMVLALRDHFPAKEYVVLPQVRNGAGFSATRTADCLVMSVWPSRGLHLYGIEIKVSRGDWLRELHNPKKADEIAEFCDFWFVAAGSDRIVEDGELPATWGLLIPGSKPGSLRIKHSPIKLGEPKPVTRSFLAAILKTAFAGAVPFSAVDAEIERRVAEKLAAVEAGVRTRLEKELDKAHLLDRNTQLEAVVKAFEQATGCYIGSSVEQARNIGKALKMLQWNGVDKWLERYEDQLKRAGKEVRELRAELPKSEPEGKAA